MVLWWIANAVLLFVIAPVVIILANRLIRTTMEIKEYADDILEHGVALTQALDAVPKLGTTKQLTGAARNLVQRYGSAIVRLQGGGAATAEAGRGRSAPLSARAPRYGNGG